MPAKRVATAVARRATQPDAAAPSHKADLKSAIGSRELVGPVKVVGTLDIPLDASPLPFNVALRIAEEQRPDLSALRHKTTKADRDPTLEQRQTYPEISLGLGVAHRFQHPIGAPDVTA